MNQSRFKALKIIMQRAQVNNCPIAPIKTTLYKDTVSGKKVFVNEFKNNGDKKVLSFSVKISCFDENVKLIGTIKDYKYNDIQVAPGEEFGQNKIIACPDQSINSLAIVVTHVELEDDYFWDESIGKVLSHADSIEEEIQIEMAPVLMDDDAIVNEVEKKIETVKEEIVTPITIETPITQPMEQPIPQPVEQVMEQPVDAVVESSAPEPRESVNETIVSGNPIASETQVTSDDVADESIKAAQEALRAAQESVLAAQKAKEQSGASSETPVTPVAAESVAVPSEEKVQPQTEEKKQPIEVELNFDNTGRNKKKSKKPLPKGVKIFIGLVVSAALIFVAVIAILKYKQYSDYNRGAAFMANGQYEYAIGVYTRLGDYSDSKTLLVEAKKAYAGSLRASGEFAKAVEEYADMGGMDAEIKATYDEWARSLVDNKDYQAAMDMINNTELPFSDDTINYVKYNMGKNLYDEKYFEEAAVLFEKISGYEDADSMLKESYYQYALLKLQSSDYDAALEKFLLIEDYKDVKSRIKSVKYSMGKRAMDNHKFDEAVAYFEEILGYEDTKELIITCYYEQGVDCLAKFDYATALKCFEKTEGYEDTEEKYTQALYNSLLEDMKTSVTEETMEKLAKLPKNYEDSAAIIKALKKYVGHVGEYEWMTSNDKEINAKGGFEEHIIVALSYNNGEVNFTVDGHPVDLKLFVYKSGTDSDTYTMLNETTITRTFNSKIHTYKKIKQE